MRKNQVDGLRALQARLSDANSGRDKFLRKLEFAEVCLEAGVAALALPLYEEVARIIQERTLNEWEDRTVLQPRLERPGRLLRASAAHPAEQRAAPP